MNMKNWGPSTCIRAGIVIIAALCVASSALPDVRLPRLFADHMVLQRDRQVRIWGWAEPGENVTVEFGGQSRSAAADKDGRWAVKLAPMKANATPQDLTVIGRNTVKLTDIVVGDV